MSQQPYEPYSVYKPKPKPKATYDDTDRLGFASLVGFGGLLMAVIYTGICALFLACTPLSISNFFIFWIFIAIAGTMAVFSSRILAKAMNLGSQPGLIMIGWWGLHLFMLAAFCLLLDLTNPSLRVAIFYLTIIVTAASFSVVKLTEAKAGKALLNAVILYLHSAVCLGLAILPSMAVGFAITTKPNPAKEIPWLPQQLIGPYYQDKISLGRMSLFFPATYAKRNADYQKTIKLLEAEHKPKGSGSTQQMASSPQQSAPQAPPKTREQIEAEERQNYLNSLTPTRREFFLLGPESAEASYTTGLTKLITANAQNPSDEFISEFSTFLDRSRDKRRVLDICMAQHADALTAITFKTMLEGSNPGPAADKLIQDGLFKPGTMSIQIIAAAYRLSPGITLEKFKAVPDHDGLMRDMLTAIAANESTAQPLTRLALQSAEPSQRQKIYALAFKPGLDPKTLKTISEHWVKNSPETLTDSLKIYLKVITSSDPQSPEAEIIDEICALDKPDRKVEKQLNAILLASYRDLPSPAKLKTLVKWQNEETKRTVIDSLMSIKTASDVNIKAPDIRLAIELGLDEPIDHLTDVARTIPTAPDHLLDYLRTETLRVEQILLAALEKSDFRLPESENDVRLLEEVGWKTSKQKFVELYRNARSNTEKKRFQDAETKLTRYIAQTLRTYPDNNPDKGKLKPSALTSSTGSGSSGTGSGASGNSTLFATDDKVGPRSLNAEEPKTTKPLIKSVAGDVIQINSLGATEYAVVNKVESDLITVTLINRNDKMDFIAPERVVKVLGKVDDEALIRQLKTGAAASTGTAAAPGAPATPAAPPSAGADTKEAPKEAPKTAVANKPAVGMKVEAKKFGEWHDATIEKVSPDQCYLTFEGKGAGWDGWLGLANIRPVGSKKNFMMLSME